MADRTKIEWTATRHADGTVTPGATWNPVRGCTRVSPGCDNCYAIGVAHRYSWGEGLTRIRTRNGEHRPDWSGEIALLDHKLDEPRRWRKPRKVFVCSGADLFHHNVPFDFIRRVFATMCSADRHTFQVLTKRPERAAEFFAWLHGRGNYDPPANIWIGVSAEDQERWDERVTVLVHRVPAAVKFVSAEPLLGPISMRATGRLHVQWIIVGAESGPGHRPMDEDWVRLLRDQCNESAIPFFYKQRIEGGRKVGLPELDGEVWDQFPEAGGKRG